MESTVKRFSSLVQSRAEDVPPMRKRDKRKFTRRSVLMLVLALLCTMLSTSPAGADTTYVVVSGDTLSGIAQDFGVSLQDLLDANNLEINDTI